MESTSVLSRLFEAVAFVLTATTGGLFAAGYLWIETRLLTRLTQREFAPYTVQLFQTLDPRLKDFSYYQPYNYSRAFIWARQIIFGLAIFLAIEMQLDWLAWRIFTVLLEAIWEVWIG